MDTSTGTVTFRRVPAAGLYGCVQTRGFWPWLIRRATRSWANHAFVSIGDGHIIEAEPGGVRVRDISEYAGCRIAYNDTEPTTDLQRAQVAEYASNLRGEAYDWIADTTDGLAALGLRWRILGTISHRARRAVMCSELVAEAGRAANLDWLCGQPDPAQVTPAMLAQRLTEQPWNTNPGST